MWIWIDPANADRIVAALDEFGFGGLGLRVEDFLEPNVVVQLGHEPQRIDLLTFSRRDSARGRLRRSARSAPRPSRSTDPWSRRCARNKRATGRLRDLADIEGSSPGVVVVEPRRPRRQETRAAAKAIEPTVWTMIWNGELTRARFRRSVRILRLISLVFARPCVIGLVSGSTSGMPTALCPSMSKTVAQPASRLDTRCP